MAELDRGSTTTPGPAATSATSGALVLTPPAPVVIIEEQQAATSIPLGADKEVELRERAAAFVADLTAVDTRSPEFARRIAAITSMGEQDIRAAAAFSARMLQRPAAAVRGLGAADAQTRVATTLADLRTTVTGLDPGRSQLTGARKVFGWLPGGSPIDRYFARYQSAQSDLDTIIKSLSSGQDELRKDNAAIETEKANMWAAMAKLTEYCTLAAGLDTELEATIAELDASGRTHDAQALRSDALFPVRQRRQDFMTLLAVCLQGHMALDLVRRNNLELVKGVDRAQTTTVAAVRTAVVVSQALARQELVLDRMTSLTTATSDLIESTSQQRKGQGAQQARQADAATVAVATLQAAFDNVFTTMDTLDTFRAQAVASMAQTVIALEGQIARAQPHLERTRQPEARP